MPPPALSFLRHLAEVPGYTFIEIIPTLTPHHKLLKSLQRRMVTILAAARHQIWTYKEARTRSDWVPSLWLL